MIPDHWWGRLTNVALPVVAALNVIIHTLRKRLVKR